MKIWFPLAFALLTLLLVHGQRVLSAAGEAPPHPPQPDDSSLELPDSSAIRCPTVPEAEEGAIKTLAFSPDGKVVAAGNWHGFVKVFDSRSGRPIVSFRPRGERSIVSFPPIAFTPDGKALAAPNAPSQWGLFDPATGRQLRAMDPGPDLPGNSYQAAVALSPDGKLLAGSYNTGVVVLWDVASGRRLRVLPPYIVPESSRPRGRSGGIVRVPARPAQVQALAFSPDGATLYAAGQILRAWDVAATTEPRRLDVPAALPCGRLAVAPDGKTVAAAIGFDGPAGEARSIILLDAASGRKRAEIPSNQAILGLAFLPDGRTLVSLEGYRDVRLWNAATGQPVAACRFEKHFRLEVLAVSINGRRIAAGGQESDHIFGVIGMIETDGATLHPWHPAPGSAPAGP